MVSQPAGLNCTSSPWELKPNSDISGAGILTGFAVTAFSTLLLCFAYYMVDHKHRSNPFDQYFIDKFYHLFGLLTPSETSKKWTKALRATVLTFSDQQVITGIAILISGYSQLRGGLAVYYWQLTVDLAWFSSITHLTTLTCLRYYFQKRKGLRILRLIFMAVTAGMLSCALASTGYLGGDNFTNDYPAWCLLHRTLLEKANGGDNSSHGDIWTRYYNTDYIALVLSFLCVSYGVRIIQLFPSGLDLLRDKLRKDGHSRLSSFAQIRLQKYKNRASGNLCPNYWALVYTLTMAIYCISKAAADLYSSMLWEMTWLATALVWGSIRIIEDRELDIDIQTSDPGPYLANESDPASYSDVYRSVLEDNSWGFGQVVAVALLMIPLFSFVESIYESVLKDRKKSRQLPTTASTNSRSPGPQSDSPSSSAEPWKNLYKCAWFPSLVWLIYLQSLALASIVLFIFPFAGGNYDLKQNIGSFFRFYLAWFGFNLALLLLFTITSLSLSNVQDISKFGWTWRPKMLAKRTKQIQRILLIVSVFGLSASSATFGWKTLFNSTFFSDT